ncbi:MAG: heterodisulfide reductase-related iron-sulfur binding cluster, partial [Mycobacterium sp.]
FDVPVYGEDVDSFDGYEYLFWVGCAGAYDDKAKKTTKAVAELLASAGVKFLVLGTGETCNGDSARRAGNEFLFQQLAQQAKETLDGLFEGVETVDRKIVVTCPHCFNTLGREYKQLGANYSVLHHTQLLNRLVRDKKLVPVSPVSEDITYHDPCFLGRHNKVYEAPRELINAAGAKLTEMPRHADRSFCCGAGGARMWMEEHIGKRINHERVDEALATGATTVATACPFCRVMVTDGVNDRQEEAGREGVDVRDVAQLLLESLDRDSITLPEKGTAAKQAEERAEKAAPKAPEAHAAPAATEPAKTEDKDDAAADMSAKAVTGLGIAGGAKRPGAKKEAPASDEKPAEAKESAAPVKGLGIAGGAKRPGAKKAAAKPEAAAESAPAAESVTQSESAPAAPVKGLGLAAGAKRPGAKKTAATPQASTPSEPAAQPESKTEAPAESEAKAPAAPVKGLGIAAGAKRPGAKKTAAAAQPASPKPKTEAESKPEPEAKSESLSTPADSDGDANGEAAPQPPVKGLGIARGARPPGKR